MAALLHPRKFAGDAAPLIIEGLFSFQVGGSERIGADVALECVRRGYRVLCFAFYDSDGPVRRELEAGGVECVDLSYLSRMRYIRRFTYQLALFRFLRRRNAHALHIHHATSLILGALPARFAGVPRVIMTEHSIIEFQTMPKYRRQSRRYCRFAHAISVVHSSMEPYFRSELHVPADQLHCIPNGVRLLRRDPIARARLRRELGITGEQFLWMYAGRLAAVKDLGTLLKAFSIASDAAPGRSKLAIVGDGPERGALEQSCRLLKLDALVSFLGTRTDVPQLMQAADGFAMSSLSEGLPMVLLEAMAARVPCVATSVGGIPQLFSGGAGLLAAPQDAPALAHAMRALTADPERRRHMSDAAFAKIAASNDLVRVVDQYLRLFELPPRWPHAVELGAHGADAG
jgi:glycosyltransferase involved in cell wall biosynthesis